MMPLDSSAITDADHFKFLSKPLVAPVDHIVDQGAVQAVKLADVFHVLFGQHFDMIRQHFYFNPFNSRQS